MRFLRKLCLFHEKRTLSYFSRFGPSVMKEPLNRDTFLQLTQSRQYSLTSTVVGVFKRLSYLPTFALCSGNSSIVYTPHLMSSNVSPYYHLFLIFNLCSPYVINYTNCVPVLWLGLLVIL